MADFNGLGMGLGHLAYLSAARTRSISAENATGEKGRGGMATEGTGAHAARDLGQGWKISPSIHIVPGATATLADIRSMGAIQHIWLTTHPQHWRRLILRFYWEEDERPAVEVPVGDFFCQGWGQYSQVSSLPVAVNPHGGFNSYWEMPFRRAARVTIENLSDQEVTLYYQITYALTDVPDHAAYFYAQWRRSNPLPYKAVHTLLDGIRGSGHYVGTYLAWGVNSSGWWGEGEIKFYLDGDEAFPTICGTGTEDYFGGAWNFDSRVRATPPSLRRSSASTRSCARTGSTAASSASACTAGTSWIRFGLAATSASRSRRSAGAQAGAICRCRTISPRRRSDIRRRPPRSAHRHPTPTRSR